MPVSRLTPDQEAEILDERAAAPDNLWSGKVIDRLLAELGAVRAENERLRAALHDGENSAYADVVAQGFRLYLDERNDIQDRRAIRRFIERFQARAALAKEPKSCGE